jgi:hypothetical protein
MSDYSCAIPTGRGRFRVTSDDEDKTTNTGGKIGTHGHPGYRDDEDARRHREAEEHAKRQQEEEEKARKRRRERDES